MKRFAPGRYQFLILVLFTYAAAITGQPSYQLQGFLNYSIGTTRDVFAITPDGTKLIAFTSEYPTQNGLVEVYDVLTRNRIDVKSAGFGPSDFGIAKVDGNLRVVALTTRGGPWAIVIFDLSNEGRLTQRAELLFPPIIYNQASNLVLSTYRKAGFVRKQISSTQTELISFSLDSGAIIGRLTIPISETLSIYDGNDRCLIASGFDNVLKIIDATNPSKMTLVGSAVLPIIAVGNGFSSIKSVFSEDGSVLFAGGEFARTAAVNVNDLQVTASVATDAIRVTSIKIREVEGKRLLAIRSAWDDLSRLRGFATIDATSPSKLSIVRQIDFGNEVNENNEFCLSQNGKNLVIVGNRFIRSFRFEGPSGLASSLTPRFDIRLGGTIGLTALPRGAPEAIYAAWWDSPFPWLYSISNKPNITANFNGDGRTELALFRSGTGSWLWKRLSDNQTSISTFGQEGDVPVAADYDGDEITDRAVFRPATGSWLISESSTGVTRSVNFGLSSDKPVPGDYDGDGKADQAIFRSRPNRWLINRSSDGRLISVRAAFGRVVPVAGDYDGDGKLDFATFTEGRWYINTSNGSVIQTTLGQAGDLPVSADFDFDGKSDIGVFKPGFQTWTIQRSYLGVLEVQLGQAGDIPVPADYFGDGFAVPGVFRPLTGTWYIRDRNGNMGTYQFGTAGDIPIARQF